MRSMLVEPGVRSGTPAVMMMRSPGLAKPSSIGDAAGAVDHVVEVAGVGRNHAMRAPHDRQAPRGVEHRRQRDDRHLRALARGAQAGRARRRVGDDRRELQRLGDLARGERDRVGAGRLRLGALRVDDAGIVRVALDPLGDAVHHLDRFDRILAGRRFGRQHDGVGAFEDGGRDVGHFGAGRHRRGDHRFQHLRGDHHRLAGAARRAGDLLLDAGHGFERHLDAEIAARHHQRVGQLDDLGEPRHGLRLLDLGHAAAPGRARSCALRRDPPAAG